MAEFLQREEADNLYGKKGRTNAALIIRAIV